MTNYFEHKPWNQLTTLRSWIIIGLYPLRQARVVDCPGYWNRSGAQCGAFVLESLLQKLDTNLVSEFLTQCGAFLLPTSKQKEESSLLEMRSMYTNTTPHVLMVSLS